MKRVVSILSILPLTILTLWAACGDDAPRDTTTPTLESACKTICECAAVTEDRRDIGGEDCESTCQDETGFTGDDGFRIAETPSCLSCLTNATCQGLETGTDCETPCGIEPLPEPDAGPEDGGPEDGGPEDGGPEDGGPEDGGPEVDAGES